QREEGSLCDALSQAVGSAAGVLEGLPTTNLALLFGSRPIPAPDPSRHPQKLSQHCPARRAEQARDAPFAAPFFRDPLTGSRHRPPDHSTTVGASQPPDHGVIHLRVHGESDRDPESAGFPGTSGRELQAGAYRRPSGEPHPAVTSKGKSHAMIQPRLEVAEVFREFTPAFLFRYGDIISPDQRRVLRDLARCRTAE